MGGLEFSWVERAEVKLNSSQLVTTIPHSNTEYALLLLMKLGDLYVYIWAMEFFPQSYDVLRAHMPIPILNIWVCSILVINPNSERGGC